ncbi:2Fe-2S iron-sulfur cluster-binding protein [Methylomagnum sp.]
MKQVQFSANIEATAVSTASRLLDALLARQVPVKMYCGGRGLCATCHIYVVEHPEALTPPTRQEQLRLPLLTGARPNSRLACQAQVIGENVRIELPSGLYVESLSDLESLIGKRSSVPILHPITGAILVEAHKIILRSQIMQLKDVDFSIDTVQTLPL